MVSTCGLSLVLGVDPFPGVLCTGFANGDCLWDLSLGVPGIPRLGHHTGNGKFDGETFWVGYGWFFSWGSGGGKSNSRSRYCSLFSQDDARFQTSLFMLYII
jgi:hypothetical protein